MELERIRDKLAKLLIENGDMEAKVAIENEIFKLQKKYDYLDALEFFKEVQQVVEKEIISLLNERTEGEEE